LTLFTFLHRFLIPKLFRYREEFREISFIARGGFGKVYKAQHRLDGIEYAIKKIVMPVDRIETVQQQLNEVWALAKLNHPNIVSYNGAWIEPLPSNTSTSTDRKSYRSSHASKYRKKSKSYSSQFIDDLFDNENGLNINNSKIYNEQNILDTKVSSTINICTDKKRKKKRSKVYENTDDSIISYNTISKRFEELNSSVNIIGKRIVEKSNIEEYTDESSSNVVFQNSNNNENLNQSIVDTDTSNSHSCEESTSQEVCMYTSDKVSK